MSTRKLPHTVSVEDLLKAIEQEDNTDLSKQEELINYPIMQNDIVTFLSHYTIEPGNDLVPRTMLYRLYTLWSREPVSRGTFSLEVGRFLISHQKGPKWYYMINRSSMDLTNEAFKLINEHTMDKAKSLPWRRHFENFLNKCEITPGKFFIESFVLYDLYDEYVYNIKKKTPLGYNQFINFCKIHFKAKYVKHKAIHFGVDPSIEKTLTKQRLESLRKNRLLRYAKIHRK